MCWFGLSFEKFEILLNFHKRESLISKGKARRVKKEKISNLKKELIKIKKENARVTWESDVLQRELAKLRKELWVERCNFLN